MQKLKKLETREKSKTVNLDKSPIVREREEAQREFHKDMVLSQKWYMAIVEKNPTQRTKEEWTILRLMEDNYTMMTHKLYLLTTSGKKYKKLNHEKAFQKKIAKKIAEKKDFDS